MAMRLVSQSPETVEQTQRRTAVRPHPTQEGVFILDRGELQSVVSQGVVRVGGAAVKYTYERPIDIVDSVPLLLVPGYGGIKPAYRELRKAVVANGKPAVTFKPPRSQERFAMLHPNHFLHPEILLAQSVLAIARQLIEQDGSHNEYEQVDTAGHSMGGPAVVNAGNRRPERFRSVIAMAAAGLDGHTLGDMAKRAPAVVAGEIIPSLQDMRVRRDYRSVKDIVHYVARNPWRTTAEGLAVGSGDIRDKVTHLGSLGVQTAALQFSNDHFFPLEGVREHSASRFDLFRVFPDPEANHMWPQLQPEAVANELVDMVESLQTLKQAS